MIGRAVCSLLLVFAPHLQAQRARSLEELESQIVLVLLRIEPGPISRRQELLSFGAPEEVSAVLLKILQATRNEPSSMDRSTLASSLRVRSISALGELGEKRAVPLIRSILHDKALLETVRSRAAWALGQIDAEGNKQELLRALDESFEPAHSRFRLEIARALVRVKDRSIVNKLEAQSSRELSPFVRRKFAEVVAEMKRQLPPL